MRASEVIGCDVYDSAGAHLGTVHDLRFEMSWTSGHQLVCELTGIACRRAAGVGHRLGYGMGDMAGPWPLSAMFRRMRRNSLEIDWDDVADVGSTSIELSRTRHELRADGAAT